MVSQDAKYLLRRHAMKVVNESEIVFFSVHTTMRIGEKKYTPCICYDVTGDIMATVVALKKAGKVDTYDKKVRFMSGAVVEENKKDTVPEPVLVEPSVNVNVSTGETPGEFDAGEDKK